MTELVDISAASKGFMKPADPALSTCSEIEADVGSDGQLHLNSELNPLELGFPTFR